MKKIVNNSYINGYIYQHTLEKKVTGPNSQNPGTEYIAGNLDVATDDAMTNIVTIHYSYVTATTKSGNPNGIYTFLLDLIEGKNKTVMNDGADVASKVRINSTIGLNDFYTDRSGKEELVSAKRNEGGFIHLVNALDPDEKARATFEADMVITGFSIKEADEEKNLPEKGVVKGAIFDNFRGSILPVEFSVTNPHGIAHFESLGATPKTPVFTKVKGQQISTTTTREIVEEGAWGDVSVRYVPSSRKDYVITWTSKEPYDWDNEETITAKELIEKMAARETYLATVKQNRDDYKAKQNNAPSAFAATSTTGFNF